MAKYFPGHGVRGAVFVVCPGCHHPWSVTLHPQRGLVPEVKCRRCGQVVPLTEGLRRAELRCSVCGTHAAYYTNWIGRHIHVDCRSCRTEMHGDWCEELQSYRTDVPTILEEAAP